MKVENHCGFLNDYLAELQDSGLKPTAVSNCIKAVKTFYRANGVKKVELNEPLSRKVAYKDRAPKPEEIAMMLDKAAVREGFIVAGIATGGFREGTFAKLLYRHVKEDLEAGRVPIHVHVESAITKGKYHDYDTFLNAEASHLLKLYIEDRRRGGRTMPPEELTDESPLIRNPQSPTSNMLHRPYENTQPRKHHSLYFVNYRQPVWHLQHWQINNIPIPKPDKHPIDCQLSIGQHNYNKQIKRQFSIM
jgi:hypothetical protein